MRKLTVFSLVIAAVAFGFSSLASGAKKPVPVKFTATLNVGQEVPHPKGTKAGASGHFTATLTGATLKWTLTFGQLSGPAMAAHIHTGARGVSGPVIIPLCGPCHSPLSGSATPTAAQIAALKAGKTYVNVHTAKNPGGEIRGQAAHVM